MTIISVPRNEVYINANSFTKIYPDKIRHYVYKTPSLRRLKGFENEIDKIKNLKKENNNNFTDANKSLLTSIRRTKTTISDLVLCNDFDSFATFTFAKDRYNIESIKNRMSNWLKSQQKQYGKFTYLIVPEFHKDKKAIHFHALLKGYNGSLIDSKKKINNRKCYNIKSYKHGFSTLVQIDNKDKVSSYVKKYITKDMPLFPGKKRYWCSTKLRRPEILINYEIQNNPFIDLVKQYENDYLTIYESPITIKSLATLKGENIWNLNSYQQSNLFHSKLEQLKILENNILSLLSVSKEQTTKFRTSSIKIKSIS